MAAGEDKKSRYVGKEVIITYDRNLCIHAAECGRGSAALFNVQNKPWCSPDAVSAQEAINVVARCPSGALKIERVDGGPVVTAPVPKRAHLQVYPHGPIYAAGPMTVGGAAAGPRLALCRCGASTRKPYCDGSHDKIGFRDAGAVAQDPAAGTAGEASVTDDTNGTDGTNGADDVDGAGGADGSSVEASNPSGEPLAITAAPNGPLLLSGPMTLRAASGRVAMVGNKAALCRCGASKNKPFCDGSHKAAGFTAE